MYAVSGHKKRDFMMTTISLFSLFILTQFKSVFERGDQPFLIYNISHLFDYVSQFTNSLFTQSASRIHTN